MLTNNISKKDKCPIRLCDPIPIWLRLLCSERQMHDAYSKHGSGMTTLTNKSNYYYQSYLLGYTIWQTTILFDSGYSLSEVIAWEPNDIIYSSLEESMICNNNSLL